MKVLKEISSTFICLYRFAYYKQYEMLKVETLKEKYSIKINIMREI